MSCYGSGEEGTTTIYLGRGMDGIEPVLESVVLSEHRAEWAIATEHYTIVWPARSTLRAFGDPDPRRWPYELALDGAVEEMAFLQGPLTEAQTPAPGDLIAPGMEMVAEGSVASNEIFLLRAQATEANAQPMFG